VKDNEHLTKLFKGSELPFKMRLLRTPESMVTEKEENQKEASKLESKISMTSHVSAKISSEMEGYFLLLKKPSTVLKHCRVETAKNKSHGCKIWLDLKKDPATAELHWETKDSTKGGPFSCFSPRQDEKMIKISDILELTIGHTSDVSQLHWTETQKRLSFSVRTTGRTLAFVVLEQRLFDAWLSVIGFLIREDAEVVKTQFALDGRPWGKHTCKIK